MKIKLARIHSPLRRWAIRISIRTLLVLGKFSGSRSRVHWVGYHKRRRRLERPIFAVLFTLGMVLLAPHEFAYWAVIAGGVSALFVDLYLIYLLIPRKRAHWL